MESQKRKLDDKEAKQAERKRKQEEKEEEKKQKREEREANRRKSKEESIEEIVVIIDAAWAEEERGEDVVSFLVGRGIQMRKEEADVASSVTWMRRKGSSEIEELEAKELSELVIAGKLGNYATEIQKRFPFKKLAFVVQGIESYLKKQTNETAKDYRKMVQNKIQGKEYTIEGTGSQKLTRAMVDEALVWLQIEANCNVKMTNTEIETADYLFRLTSAIAYAPYKPQSSFENFCAEAIRKKGGRGTKEDTWIEQLTQINGLSRNIAKCIVVHYPSIKSLTDVYLKGNLSETEKELLLQESATSTGRRLGGALSIKIYQIFSVTDPSAIIH